MFSRWIFSAALALLVLGALPAQAGLTSALEVLNAEKPDLERAEPLLLEVPANAGEFPLALLELQKIRYQKREWQQFFGGALYYRHRIHPEVQMPEMILLESLALLRHCQFDAAERLIRQVPQGDERADELADLLYIQTQIPGNVTTEARAPRARAFTRATEWKIPDAVRKSVTETVVNRFKDPHAIRVYVRNVCGEATSS